MPSIRTWLLRRLARRLHIGEDVLRHLSTFQRLGEQLEILAPQEMVPVGARTVVRALRSRAAPEIGPDWLWPWWLEAQHDPSSPAFIPRGHLAFTQNLTARNWTAVGNPWSPWEAVVDPRGLVTPWYDGWSLDWWVQDGHRWRYPSREAAVVQRTLGATPVVETELRLDGGVVRQRVCAQGDGEEVVVVELANQTASELEVAFALRPYNPEGLAVVEELHLHLDRLELERGVVALWLPDAPHRWALSTFHSGDARHLLEGTADAAEGALTARLWRTRPLLRRLSPRRRTPRVRDPAGLATAVITYRLPPGGQVSVAAPLLPAAAQRRRRRRGGPVRPVPPRPASAVADEWARRLHRGMQVRLPDEALQRAVDLNRAYLLVLHDPGSITPGPLTYHRFWFRDAAYMLLAMDRWGFHDEVADVLRSYPDRQRADGFMYSQWREWDANGAALFAVANHHRLAGDVATIRALYPMVVRAARWIDRTRRRRRRHRDPRLRGLMPPGISAEHLGPYDYYYWDDFWSWRGLLDAAELAAVVGDTTSAQRWRTAAAEFARDIRRSIALAARRTGRAVIPAGPRRRIDAGMIGSLVACEPLRLLPPDDPYLAGTLAVIRERFCVGEAFYQGISHTGLGTYLTAQLALCELEQRDLQAWRRLRWLLGAATPTATWPEAIHPRLGGGCMGDGHHGWAAAEFLSLVRQLLVREDREGGLSVLTLFPEEWHGRPVEVRDAPTAHGRISYRLAWEGDHPVLRWERERAEVPLRCPSLAPGWESLELTGELRFGPVGERSAAT